MSIFGEYPDGDIDITPDSIFVNLQQEHKQQLSRELERYLYDSSPSNVVFPTLGGADRSNVLSEYLESRRMTTSVVHNPGKAKEFSASIAQHKGGVSIESINWMDLSERQKVDNDIEYVDSRSTQVQGAVKFSDLLKEYSLDSLKGSGRNAVLYPFHLNVLPEDVVTSGKLTSEGLVLKKGESCAFTNVPTALNGVNVFLSLQLETLPEMTSVLFQINEQFVLSVTPQGTLELQGKTSLGGIPLVVGRMHVLHISVAINANNTNISVKMNNSEVQRVKLDETASNLLEKPQINAVSDSMTVAYVSFGNNMTAKSEFEGQIALSEAMQQKQLDRYLTRDRLSLKSLFLYPMATWVSPLWKFFTSSSIDIHNMCNFAYLLTQHRSWFVKAFSHLYEEEVTSKQWEKLLVTLAAHMGMEAKYALRRMSLYEKIAILRIGDSTIHTENAGTVFSITRVSATKCEMVVSSTKPETLRFFPTRQMNDGTMEYLHTFLIKDIDFEHISSPLLHRHRIFHADISPALPGACTYQIHKLTNKRWVDILQEALGADAKTRLQYHQWANLNVFSDTAVYDSAALILRVLALSSGFSIASSDSLYGLVVLKLVDMVYSDLHAIGLPYHGSDRCGLASQLEQIHSTLLLSTKHLSPSIKTALKHRTTFLQGIAMKPRTPRDDVPRGSCDLEFEANPEGSTEFSFADFLNVREIDFDGLQKDTKKKKTSSELTTRKAPTRHIELYSHVVIVDKLTLLEALHHHDAVQLSSVASGKKMQAAMRQSFLHLFTVIIPFPGKDTIWDTTWSTAEMTACLRLLFIFSCHIARFFQSYNAERQVLLGTIACMCDYLIHRNLSDTPSAIVSLLAQFGMKIGSFATKTQANVLFTTPEIVILRTRVIEYLNSTEYKYTIFTWAHGDVSDDLLLFADTVCAHYSISAPIDESDNDQLPENLYIILSSATKNTQKYSWDAFEFYRDVSFLFRAVTEDSLSSPPSSNETFMWSGEAKCYSPNFCSIKCNTETAVSPATAQYYINRMTRTFQISKTTKLTPYSAATEEEVNTLNELPQFPGLLTDNEVHKLLTVLTVPALRLDGLVDFFCKGKIDLIKNDDFHTMLLHVLLEPGVYTSDDVEFTSIPAEPEQIGARFGLLFQELVYNPQVFHLLLDAFQDLLSNHIPSSFYSARSVVIARWVMIVAYIMDFAKYLDKHSGSFSIAQQNLASVKLLITRVDTLFSTIVTPAILTWVKTLHELSTIDFSVHFSEITDSELSVWSANSVAMGALSRFMEEQDDKELENDKIGMSLDSLIRTSFNNGHLQPALLQKTKLILNKLYLLSENDKSVCSLANLYVAGENLLRDDLTDFALEKKAFTNLRSIMQEFASFVKSDALTFLTTVEALLKDRPISYDAVVHAAHTEEWVGPMSEDDYYYRRVDSAIVTDFCQGVPETPFLRRLRWEVENKGPYLSLLNYNGLVADTSISDVEYARTFSPQDPDSALQYLTAFFADVEHNKEHKYTKTTVREAHTVLHTLNEPNLPSSTLLLELPFFLGCAELQDFSRVPPAIRWVTELLHRKPKKNKEILYFYNPEDIDSNVFHLCIFADAGITVQTFYRNSKRMETRTITTACNSLLFSGAGTSNAYRLVTRSAESRFNLQGKDEVLLPAAFSHAIFPNRLNSAYSFARAGDSIVGYPRDLAANPYLLEVTLTSTKSSLTVATVKRRCLTMEEIAKLNRTGVEILPSDTRDMVLVNNQTIPDCNIRKCAEDHDVLFWSENGVITFAEHSLWGNCDVRSDKLYPLKNHGYYVEYSVPPSVESIMPGAGYVLCNEFGARQLRMSNGEMYLVHASNTYLEAKTNAEHIALFLYYLEASMFEYAMQTLSSTPATTTPELIQIQAHMASKSYTHAVLTILMLDKMQFFSGTYSYENYAHNDLLLQLLKHVVFSTRSEDYVLSTDVESRFLNYFFTPTQVAQLYDHILHLREDEYVFVLAYNRLQYLLALTARMEYAYRIVLPTYKNPIFVKHGKLTCPHQFFSSVFHCAQLSQKPEILNAYNGNKPAAIEGMVSYPHVYFYQSITYSAYLNDEHISLYGLFDGYVVVIGLLCSGNSAQFLLGRAILFGMVRSENILFYQALLLANSPLVTQKLNKLPQIKTPVTTQDLPHKFMEQVVYILSVIVPLYYSSPQLFNTYVVQAVERPAETYKLVEPAVSARYVSGILTDTSATSRVWDTEHASGEDVLTVWTHPLQSMVKYTQTRSLSRDQDVIFNLLDHPAAPISIPQCLDTMQRMQKDISRYQTSLDVTFSLSHIPSCVADMEKDTHWIGPALTITQNMISELEEICQSDDTQIGNINKALQSTLQCQDVNFVHVLPFIASSVDIYDLVRKYPVLKTAESAYEVLGLVELAAVVSIREVLAKQVLGYLAEIQKCIYIITKDSSKKDVYHTLFNHCNNVAVLVLRQREYTEVGQYSLKRIRSLYNPISVRKPCLEMAAPYKVNSSVFHPVELHTQRLESILHHSVDVESDCMLWRVKNRALMYDEEVLIVYNNTVEAESTQHTVFINGIKYDPTCLLVEFSKSILLRHDQLSLRDSVVSALSMNKNKVQQLLMGAGKTSVVFPLLSLNQTTSDRLTVFVVPEPLLEYTKDTLRMTFNGPIRNNQSVFEMDRNKVVDAGMIDRLLQALATRSIVLTTASSMKSAMLRLIELQNIMADHTYFARPEHIDVEISVLTEVVQLFRNAAVVVDEVDLVMHPLLSDLHFPLGKQESVPDHGLRANVALYMLQPIINFEYNDVTYPNDQDKRNLLAQFNTVLTDLSEQGAVTLRPHLVISEMSVYEQWIRPLFAEWATLYALPKLTHMNFDTLLSYFLGEEEFPVIITKEEECKLVLLLHSWIDTYMPYICRLVNLVNYGVLTTKQFAAKLAENPYVSETRELVAIPFVAKDTPSHNSEFAHTDIMLGLTVLSYKRQGLNYRFFTKVLRKLKMQAAQEEGTMETRPTIKLFATFTNLKLDSISISSYDDMFSTFTAIKRQNQLLEWCLTDMVFPKCAIQCTQKLTASAADLPILSTCMSGFSGTPSNILPQELGICNYQVGADGATYNTLTNTRTMQVHSLPLKWTTETILQSVVNARDVHGQPQYRALIDSGALITGMTNLEVARYLLLQPALAWAKGVVYIDETGKLLIVCRNNMYVGVSLYHSGIDETERFAFYDQVHSTGVDLKHMSTARAAVTVCASMTWRDLAQAVFRMRRIGHGQTVTFFLPRDVQYMIVLRHEQMKTKNVHAKVTSGITSMDQSAILQSLMNHLLLSEFALYGTQVDKMARLDAQVSIKRAKLEQVLFNEGVFTVEMYPENAEATLIRRKDELEAKEAELKEFIKTTKLKRLQSIRKKLSMDWNKKQKAEAADKLYLSGYSQIIGKLTTVMQNIRAKCEDAVELVVDADAVVATARSFVVANDSSLPSAPVDDYMIISDMYEHTEMQAQEFLLIQREEAVTEAEQVEVQIYMKPNTRKYARVEKPWSLDLLNKEESFTKMRDCKFVGEHALYVDNLELTPNFYDLHDHGAQRVKYAFHVLVYNITNTCAEWNDLVPIPAFLDLCLAGLKNQKYSEGKVLLLSLSEAASLRKLEQLGKLPNNAQVLTVSSANHPVAHLLKWFNGASHLSNAMLTAFFALNKTNNYIIAGEYYRSLQCGRVAVDTSLAASVKLSLQFNNMDEWLAYTRNMCALSSMHREKILKIAEMDQNGQIRMETISEHSRKSNFIPLDMVTLMFLPYLQDGALSTDKYGDLLQMYSSVSSMSVTSLQHIVLPRTVARPKTQLYPPVFYVPLKLEDEADDTDKPRNAWGWLVYEEAPMYVEMPGFSDIHVYDVSRSLGDSGITVEGEYEFQHTEDGLYYLYLHPNSTLTIPGSRYAMDKTPQSGLMAVFETDLPAIAKMNQKLAKKYTKLVMPVTQQKNKKVRARMNIAKKLASTCAVVLDRAKYVFSNQSKFEGLNIEELIRRDFYKQVPLHTKSQPADIPEEYKRFYSALQQDYAVSRVQKSQYVVVEKEEKENSTDRMIYQRRTIVNDHEGTTLSVEGSAWNIACGPQQTDQCQQTSAGPQWTIFGFASDAESVTTKFNETSSPCPCTQALDQSQPLRFFGGPTGTKQRYLVCAPKLMPVRVMSRFAAAMIVTDSWVCPCCATVNADLSLLLSHCEACGLKKTADYISAGDKVCLPCKQVCPGDTCLSCCEPVTQGAELAAFRVKEVAKLQKEILQRRERKNITAQRLVKGDVVIEDNHATLDEMVQVLRTLLFNAKKDIISNARNEERKGDRRELAMQKFLEGYGVVFASDKPWGNNNNNQ